YLKGESISARSFNMLERLGRTLESDQYLGEFHTWSIMLLVFAAVILVEHVIVFALTVGGPPYPRQWIVGARFTQFTIMGLVFWRHRTHTLLPTSAAERQLWTIWIGYLFGCMVVSGINAQLLHAGVLHHELTMYPFWSL